MRSCCQLPQCHECTNNLTDKFGHAALPPAALANDMMTYYAPKILYEKRVTVMEMICASVCLTSMICFSLEKKYHGKRAFDMDVHMNNHRMGARGNVTSFPLPWQDVLQQLKETSVEHNNVVGPDLPRSPEELSNFVSVLLKTSDDEDSIESLARFVHQALDRRDVVTELITEMKASGHPAYQHVDLEKMREKAVRTLPANPKGVVPGAVAKLIPFDSLIDNIQVQKQGTPIVARATLEEVTRRFDEQKPNGVGLETSSCDEADINAQRIGAVRHLATKLNLEMEDEIVSGDGSTSDATNNDSGGNNGHDEDNSSKLAKRKRDANQIFDQKRMPKQLYANILGRG